MCRQLVFKAGTISRQLINIFISMHTWLWTCIEAGEGGWRGVLYDTFHLGAWEVLRLFLSTEYINRTTQYENMSSCIVALPWWLSSLYNSKIYEQLLNPCLWLTKTVTMFMMWWNRALKHTGWRGYRRVWFEVGFTIIPGSFWLHKHSY